jgi:hypothetical protein
VETVRAVITAFLCNPFAEVFENKAPQAFVGIGVIDHPSEFLPLEKAPAFNLLKIDLQFETEPVIESSDPTRNGGRYSTILPDEG